MEHHQEGGFIKETSEEQTKPISSDAQIALPYNKNPACEFCSSIPIDKEFLICFNKQICSKCKHNIPLITKSTCITDYLLTQEEINTFNYISRINPHKSSWSNMQLYLKSEIEDFAIKKSGSLEKIEEIKELRKQRLFNRKKCKLKKRIKELSKKTFIEEEVYEKHKHVFINENGISKCECGFVIEEEEL